MMGGKRMKNAAMRVKNKAYKEKEKMGPTKAEIVSKFLDDLKVEQSGGVKEKFTLKDLVAKKRLQQSKTEGSGEGGEVATDVPDGGNNGGEPTVPTPKQITTELHKIMEENEDKVADTKQVPAPDGEDDFGELDATKDSGRTGNVEASLVDDAINLSVSSSGSESSSDDDTDAE